jgi:hypothetical protein
VPLLNFENNSGSHNRHSTPLQNQTSTPPLPQPQITTTVSRAMDNIKRDLCHGLEHSCVSPYHIWQFQSRRPREVNYSAMTFSGSPIIRVYMYVPITHCLSVVRICDVVGSSILCRCRATQFYKLPPWASFTHSQWAVLATCTHVGAAYGVVNVRLYSCQSVVLSHWLLWLNGKPGRWAVMTDNLW